MAIELAEMYVSVIPEAKGVSSILSRQFRPAQGIASTAGRQSGEQFTSSFQSRTSRLGQGLATVLKAGVAAAAVGVGAAGMVGIKTAAQLETAQIGFTTMLGSAKKARSFLGELGKFAEKTPFDLPGLQESASSLVSIGIDSKKVIPIMTSLGNVTSGMGTGAEGIKRATTAIQQMNAAGKISAEDLNQLRDAGVPVYDLLTAATGKTTAQISEMRDKGELGRKELEALMTALETGKGLERFNGLMEKQSQSLTGLWSTAKDVFSVGMANAIKPLIPLIKDGLVGATDLLSTVVLPKIQSGLKAVVGFGDRVIKAKEVLQAGGINSEVAAALGLTGRTSEIFQEAIGGIRAFVHAFKAGGDDITSGGFAAGFAGAMEVIGLKTRKVVDAVKSLDFSSWDGFLSSLQSGGGQAGAAIASIGDSFVTLLPAFKEFATSVPSLANGGLQVLAGAFAFLADHVDTIIKYMPLLVAGFVAYKAAVIANNIVGRQSAVGVLLQVGANRSLAASNRALAASQTQVTAATAVGTTTQKASLLTRIRATAAAVGHKVALIASTVATKAATLAQKGLNLVLKRNPIGLIITAVAALVAGLVWFFTKTEIGQKIVRKAWSAIKTGVTTVVNWFKNTALPFMTKVWDVIGAGAKWLYEEKIRPAWRGIKRAAFLVVDWFKNTLAPGIDKVVDGVGSIFSWLWKENVKPVFGWIGDKVRGVWRDYIKPAFKSISAAVKKLPDAFSAAKDGIGKAWDKLKEVAKKPIRFVVEKVINDGLIGTFNKIPGVKIPDVKLPKGFAKGGRAPSGWAMVGEEGPELVNFSQPGRVYTAKQTGAALAHGEHALSGPMPGSQPFIQGWLQQRIAKSGVLNVIPMGGFPFGTTVAASNAWNGRAGVDVNAMRASAAGYKQAKQGSVYVNHGYIPSHPGAIGLYSGGSITMRPGNSMEGETLIHEIGHALGIHHNTGNYSIMHPMLRGGGATWPTPYDTANLQRIYGPPGAGAKPGQPGAFTAPGNPFDGLVDNLVDRIRDRFPAGGMFIDAAVGLAKAGINKVHDWVGDLAGNLGKKISGVAGGIVGSIKDFFGGGESTNPRVGKYGNVGQSFPGTLYDDGGKVLPGTTLVNNQMPKPEALLNPGQWDTARRAISRASDTPTVSLSFEINETTAPHEVAQQVMGLVRWELEKQGVQIGG